MPIDTPYPATPEDFARQAAEERQRTEAVTLERNTALDALEQARAETAAVREELRQTRAVLDVALEAVGKRPETCSAAFCRLWDLMTALEPLRDAIEGAAESGAPADRARITMTVGEARLLHDAIPARPRFDTPPSEEFGPGPDLAPTLTALDRRPGEFQSDIIRVYDAGDALIDETAARQIRTLAGALYLATTGQEGGEAVADPA